MAFVPWIRATFDKSKLINTFREAIQFPIGLKDFDKCIELGMLCHK